MLNFLVNYVLVFQFYDLQTTLCSHYSRQRRYFLSLLCIYIYFDRRFFQLKNSMQSSNRFFILQYILPNFSNPVFTRFQIPVCHLHLSIQLTIEIFVFCCFKFVDLTLWCMVFAYFSNFRYDFFVMFYFYSFIITIFQLFFIGSYITLCAVNLYWVLWLPCSITISLLVWLFLPFHTWQFFNIQMFLVALRIIMSLARYIYIVTPKCKLVHLKKSLLRYDIYNFIINAVRSILALGRFFKDL